MIDRGGKVDLSRVGKGEIDVSDGGEVDLSHLECELAIWHKQCEDGDNERCEYVKAATPRLLTEPALF